MRRLLAGCAVLAAVGLALAQADPPLEASTRELDQLREEIRATRAELDNLTGREADAAQALDRAKREARLVRELTAGLDARGRLLEARRDSLQVSLSAHQDAYRLRQSALAKRLRALSARGSQRELELILTSDSFSTLVTRLRFTAILARLDASLMNDTRRQGELIAAEQRELQVALTGLWEAREEASQQRDRLLLLEATQSGMVRELKAEKSQTVTALESLEGREKKLLEVLNRLEQQRRAAPPPPAGGSAGPSADGRLTGRLGDLGWPVAGEVVQGFGKQVHPQFKTVTMSNGISIAAPSGAPVYAVAAGTVEFAEHLPGFGLCVILDHGAGQYTLYANLAHVFVSTGRDVSQGQVLAELGQGQSGERPQLYFEVRHGRDPQDPLLWLSRQR